MNKMKIRSRKTMRFRSLQTNVPPEDVWGSLQNVLDRGNPPTYETSFNYQIHGIYSLPEFWSKLQASGSVDQWSYVIKLSDAVLDQGKLNARELTEDELKEIENKKKPPPKINKKDLDAVKAEEERIARELKEKEDKEKEFQAMLDKMQPDERFYYLKEMPTKEPWIAWSEKNITAAMKQGDKLIELEEDVNVHKGTLLELSFVPNDDENEKKRPKPKGINPDEVKPIYCVSWIDLSEFNTTPGLTEITLRSKLMLRSTYEERIDLYEEKTGVKEFNPMKKELWDILRANKQQQQEEEAGSDEVQQQQQQQQPNVDDELYDYVEKAQTYVYIKIVLSQPINPILPDVPLPHPNSLIKKDDKKLKDTSTTTNLIENDLLRQFKIAIAAIAKTYDDAMGESSKGVLIRRDKGNTLSNAKREERDNTINKFLEKFNNSGRANLLKEKLKKFIVKIVREKYNKKNTSVKGVYKDNRDQFYSELYAYLTDNVKKATDEFVFLKQDEIHEHIITTFTQSKKEIMNYAVRYNKEPEDKRLRRLSYESELLDDYVKAVKYYKSILTLEPTKATWLNYLKLAKKLEDDNEVEIALNKAITIDDDVDDLNLKIVYCGLLYTKGQLHNAINYMNLILMTKGLNNTSCLFNAFLAFLYKERIHKNDNTNTNTNVNVNASNKGSDNGITQLNSSPNVNMSHQNPNKANELLFLKHFEAAKVFKLRSLMLSELQQQQQQTSNEQVVATNQYKGNPKLHPEYQHPALTVQQCDSIWFDTINLFNSYNFYEISEKLLNFINDDSKNDYNCRISQAKIFLYRKEYDKVIDECDIILEEQPTSYMSHLLKGHAYYYTKQYTNAETCYIKAIRFKPQHIPFDIEMLTKLSLLYINTNSFYEAKVMLQEILRNSTEHSFAWRYLGIVLTRLGEYDEAETALERANVLDVDNPITWAYLTIYCLCSKRKEQALECLNELNKVNYSDVAVLKEIAILFKQNEEYVVSANLYRKILCYTPSDAECYVNIAEIYYEHDELNKRKAIEVLKEGKDKVIDEDGLKRINDMMKSYMVKEKNAITLGNDYVKEEEDEFDLTESQIKGEDFFKDEDVIEEEEEK